MKITDQEQDVLHGKTVYILPNNERPSDKTILGMDHKAELI